MKRTLITLAVAVLLTTPVWASGGLGVLVSGWDTDEADTDAGGGIFAEFGVTESVDLEVRTTWYNSQFTIPGIIQVDFNATPIDLGLTYNFLGSSRVTPYLGAGGTYYLIDTKDRSQGRLDDEWGYYGLAGIDIGLGPSWGLFLEVMYRNGTAALKGDDLQFSPVEIRFDLTGAVANLGLKYSW